MVTSKPTPAFMSQLGHYNFLYPNFNQTLTLEAGTQLTRLPWQLQDKCTPFLMVVSGSTIVVWIEM